MATTSSPESLTQINDPVLIFQRVWDKLVRKYGTEQLCFPREIIFLMGAPGSGKGTNTPFILRERGITANPLVMSDLLNTPEAEEIKKRAGLVSDFMVVELLLERLLSPEYQLGVVVDGFPRSNVQVGIVNLLHNQMLELRKQFAMVPTLAFKFPRPIFRVTVLFVDEKLSIERQLDRGRRIREHNEKVQMGQVIGDIILERPTDSSEDAARNRYAVFAQNYDTLETLRAHFTFNIIPATGTIEEVEKAIVKEFTYQSQLELNEETFNAIHSLPTSAEITLHARQEMVRRLDNYASQEPDMFQAVVHCLQNEFYGIIKVRLTCFAFCVVDLSIPSFNLLVLSCLTSLLSIQVPFPRWSSQDSYAKCGVQASFRYCVCH